MKWERFKTVLLSGMLLVFCCLPAMAGQDTLVQVSTIDALLSGLYDRYL